ncbi:MAG: hypothetical protein ACR2JP_01905 [Acidimicrobiia bacterium]
MSMGLASGPILLFLTGATSRYIVAAGATVDDMLAMESAAGPGEILMAPSAAALVPEVGGEPKAGGVLLAAAPHAEDPAPEPEPGARRLPLLRAPADPQAPHRHLQRG